MQITNAILSVLPSLIFGLGTVVTIIALRRAPEGAEDADGFKPRHPFAMPKAAREKAELELFSSSGTRFI